MFMDPRPQGYLARKHASGKEGIDRHDDIRIHADNNIVECLLQRTGVLMDVAIALRSDVSRMNR